jgi:hypothetical protein
MRRNDSGYAEAAIEPKPGKKNKSIAFDISILVLRLWAFSLFFGVISPSADQIF